MDRRLARRLVALAAAYAVALNTLLPVLAAILPPTAVGEVGLTGLCPAGAPERGAPEKGAPARPQPLCPCGAACAMPGWGAAALPEADPAAARPVWVPVGWRGHDGGPAPTIWPGGSKLARGPPVA